MIDRDGAKDRLLAEASLVFAPNAPIPVGSDPFVETLGDVRADYVAGRIEIEEFERRVAELLADA